MAKFFKKSGACGTERVNPSITAGGNILARPILAINRQPLELESCSNPLTTLASGWFWQFSQKKQQFLVALPTP